MLPAWASLGKQVESEARVLPGWGETQVFWFVSPVEKEAGTECAAYVSGPGAELAVAAGSRTSPGLQVWQTLFLVCL